MSLCTPIAAGRRKGCGKNTRGGIKYVDLCTFSAATSGGWAYTVDANDLITGTTQTGATYFRFEMPQNQASFNVSTQYGDGGSLIYQSDLELVFYKNEYLLRKSAIEIIEAETQALVTTVDDSRVWLCNEDFGMESSASAFNWGQSFTDSNEVRITLTVQESAPPKQVDSALITTMLDGNLIDTSTVYSA